MGKQVKALKDYADERVGQWGTTNLVAWGRMTWRIAYPCAIPNDRAVLDCSFGMA